MLKIGLPSCCTKPVPELSLVDDRTTTRPNKCCPTAKKLPPEASTGNQRSSPSTTPTPNVCCSSSPTVDTCCSRPPTIKSTQPYTAPALKVEGSSSPSNKPVRTPRGQYSTSSTHSPASDDHQSLLPGAIDLEKGTVMDHAVIQISGMTCTGCERKLKRVLSGIPGVHNVKTSLVLGRAEFDVDAGLSINHVVSLLERKTDFNCTVRKEGHRLEVLIPGPMLAPALRLRTTAVPSENGSSPLPCGLGGPPYPPGVEDIKIVDSKGREWNRVGLNTGLPLRLGAQVLPSKPYKYRALILYNPHVVGARDLLEKSFGTPLSLGPLNSDQVATDAGHLRRALYMTLLSMLFTVPILIMAWAPLPPHTIAYGCISLVLATIVQFIVAGPFYPKALKALLFSGMIEMDLLIVISTTTAYIYSVVAFVYEVRGRPLSTGEFFETSTLLVTLITCGRLASAYARWKAAHSFSIQALQPSKAIICNDGQEGPIDIRKFQYGDIFKVLPDSVVPTDGIIMSGESEIDESMITGEVVPVPKFPGSQIVGGSINGSGPVIARLTKLPIDNTINRIANLVDEARLSKPRIQDTADQVASYFVPVILVLTVIIFLIWIAVGLAVRDTRPSDAIVTAITYALAALVVSCPCAIGLAVPMVMVIAGGVGAKHGVVVKSPEAIENARNISHVIFDKTGTLTQGRFVVVEEVYREEPRKEAASIIKQLTANSKHPVSQALATHLESLEIGPIRLESVSSVVGKGMHATLEGQTVRGGNPSYVDAVEDPDVQRFQSQGLTVFCLRHDSALLAIFGLRDALRADTASVISSLQARNVAVSVVSGDSSAVVNKLARELGIPLSHVRGQCSPEDKARYVTSLLTAQTGSRKKGSSMTTIFCGDGSNDAVALAKADIGVHIAGGTDVAKNATDVVLTHASLAGILVLMDLSRASMRRVHLNFVWSFLYNLFAILLAAGAFVTVRIPPAYAGLGELVSVLPVIAVAMQIRWKRFQK